MVTPNITPLALRTRWALRRLQRVAREEPATGSATDRPYSTMGLVFHGRVGLAAGFDRQGTLWSTGHRLGFAAIECAAPGVAALAGGGRRRAVRGVSLTKPPGLPWTAAEGHFRAALRAEARHADYLTLNPGRERPDPAYFAALVAAVCSARGERSLPVVVKLPAAWLAAPERIALARTFVAAGAAGLLLSAEGMADAETVLGEFAGTLDPQVCLISVGGIASPATALARLRAGADLLQLHRGLIAHRPSLLAAINIALESAATGPRKRLLNETELNRQADAERR